MPVVDGVMSPKGFSGFKRAVEVLMETSDMCRVEVGGPDPDRPVHLVTVDALWVCTNDLMLHRTLFEYVDFGRHMTARVPLQLIHGFLRSCKTQRHIRWFAEDTPHAPLCLHVLGSGPNMHLVLKDHDEPSPFGRLPPMNWRQWPGFTVDAAEFGNIILDQTSSGSTLQLAVNKQQFTAASRFETGQIEHCGRPPFVALHRVREKTCRSAPLLVKFLKVLASMSTLTTNVHGFIQHDGAVVVECTEGKNDAALLNKTLGFTLRLWLIPYTGRPRAP
jgi:hypothetical protein